MVDVLYQVYSTDYYYSRICPKCNARYGGGDGRDGLEVTLCNDCAIKKKKVAEMNSNKEKYKRAKRRRFEVTKTLYEH